MAIVRKVAQVIEFTNADTLPVVGIENGTIATNTDTGIMYTFNGASWASFVVNNVPEIPIGGTSTNTQSSGDGVYILSEATIYTLPLLSSITSKNFFMYLKNLSGASVTINTTSPDTFDTGEISETSIIVPYGYTLSIYVHSSGFLRTQNI